MKSPVWSPEKLQALTQARLEQLRDNARRLGNEEVLEACNLILSSRAPVGRPVRTSAPKSSDLDVVTGYHFVCQSDRGVELNTDGTFWSGSWVVAEENVRTSLKYGAYVALHNSKSEPSYRQGDLVDYRKGSRGMVAKSEDGIEFRVRPTPIPYTWVGAGAGEKGYAWSKLKVGATGGSRESE
jgi:hypothetical protein